MIEDYFTVFLFAGLFTGLACVMLAVSSLVGPRGGGRVKGEAYECGMEMLQPNARERYSIPFYLVAILFILFDVETVFLVPWAVGFSGLSETYGAATLLLEAFLFLGVLALGLVYVIYRRGLEWD